MYSPTRGVRYMRSMHTSYFATCFRVADNAGLLKLPPGTILYRAALLILLHEVARIFEQIVEWMHRRATLEPSHPRVTSCDACNLCLDMSTTVFYNEGKTPSPGTNFRPCFLQSMGGGTRNEHNGVISWRRLQRRAPLGVFVEKRPRGCYTARVA